MSFADKLKKFTNDAVEKGKGLAEQGKLALENQKQLDVIKHAQQLIGAYIAENNLLADDEYVMSQLSAIAAANEIIEKNSSRINELKTAASDAAEEVEDAVEEVAQEAAEAAAQAAPRAFCPECGKEVAVDARFCPNCGKAL